jgi:Holliday junction resolvasome RuvABC endonuclease subunit
MPQTILGIDPGTREMGIAVLRDGELIAKGVYTLRNGERPHDVIGQVKRIVLSCIAEHAPGIVGIEAPLPLPTKRAAVLSVIAQELRARSRELRIAVVELSPREVRRRVVGNPFATKLDVARALAKLFPEIRSLVPQPPKRAVLGLRPRDRYWLHVFDALAVATAIEPIMSGGTVVSGNRLTASA